MDDDTLNLLRTVCVAGRARASYDGNANARLEKLVEEGFLREVSAAHAGASASTGATRRQYQPTEQGRAMLRRLNEKGAA